MAAIYCITNLINNKKYIGKTELDNPNDRLQGHIEAAKYGSNYLIHKAIRKYGVEQFRFDVIESYENIDSKQLSERETINIVSRNSYAFAPGGHGYSMIKGGDGFDRATASYYNRINLERGLNPWQGDKGRKLQLRRIAEGTNPFAGKLGSDLQARLLDEGKHNSQIKVTCTHCGVVGGSNVMHLWHFANCQTIKPLDESIRENKRRAIREYVDKKVTCPHCHKMGGGGAMYRWHFDNCKDKNI